MILIHHIDSLLLLILGQVLRFYALRVESDAVYSDTWPVIIHYYLVDDTVEIREVHEHNSGRDPFPLFLRRQRIPKKLKSGRRFLDVKYSLD